MDLNEAIKAHSEWKMKLRNAISTKGTLDAETIAKDNCCTLGKWLHGESKVQWGKLPSHIECMKKHAMFHTEAAKVAKAINGKQYKEAESMLGSSSPYATTSAAVVMAIGTLKREAGL